MSDREWIDRVRSSRPEDLSSGDVGRLRDEARRSPELRKALADEIRLDQALHAAAGRPPLSTSKIVAHVTAAAAAAGTATAVGGGLISSMFGWFSVIVLTTTVAVVGVLIIPEPGSSPQRETLSPQPSIVQESPRAPIVERADPLEDPRFADDGSSPSDKVSLPHPDEPAPGQPKSSPGTDRQVSPKTEATVDSAPTRGGEPRAKASVSQK
jgi:hypothetical protein